MDKFARTAHALLHNCKQQADPNFASTLPRPLVRRESDFFRPLDMEQIPAEWICGPTDPDFYHRFLSGQLSKEECRLIGFREQTHRPELIRRTVLEVAGTVLTAQLAVLYGLAGHVAGGTHHAHPKGGAGYTILNDLAIATHVLTEQSSKQQSCNSEDIAMDSLVDISIQRKINRVLVIDCDVHQGDGTAKFMLVPCLQGKLATLSLHCASNYPQPKAQSTYDIGLPDSMHDSNYLQILRDSVNLALSEVQPDLVLYDAGVDIYKGDTLGRLNVSEQGIRQRDRWVLERCVKAGIPVAGVIGGGYDKNVDALARRHAILHEECSFVWRKYKMWERPAWRELVAGI